MRRIFRVLVVVWLVAGACSDGGVAPPSTVIPPGPSTSQQPTTPTTVPQAVTTTPVSTVEPVVSTTLLEELITLPSVAVGAGGIEYRQGAEDLEASGPSHLAIDPRGGFHFDDPVGGRIWSVVEGQVATIDLKALDILVVTAMAASADHLIIVEIFFALVRHRVHRLAYDGTVVETIQIPEGFRFEDGFSGVLAGDAGEIALVLEDGQAYGLWDASTSTFERSTTVTFGRSQVAPLSGGLNINGTGVDAALTGLGGMRYLGSARDGTVAIVRIDVLETAPVFRVLTTVEWYDPEANFIGSALVPSIEDQFTRQVPGIAVADDGSVYALVTRRDEIAVVQLAMEDRRILSFEEPI